LLADRNKPENRVHGRNRRGVTLVQRDGSLGVGSYTMGYRENLLTRLLGVQAETELDLISEAEIIRIKEIWAEEITHLALKDAGVTA